MWNIMNGQRKGRNRNDGINEGKKDRKEGGYSEIRQRIGR
jgi:hypothetical protein